MCVIMMGHYPSVQVGSLCVTFNLAGYHPALCIGPFVMALESAANVTAQILGKPTRRFFETTLESLTSDGIEREMWVNSHPGHSDAASRSIVIIGDDINNDLGEGAIELNLRRVLGE